MRMNREKQREYMKRCREKRLAQGLTSNGTPRKCTAHHPSAEESRALGLEAILWMATKEWRKPAYLLGLHAFAATLPIDWWGSRMHFSIATLVDALERERQARFEVAA